MLLTTLNKMVVLNNDCIDTIIDNVDINSIENAMAGLGLNEKDSENTRKKRMSPVRIFSNLTSKPEDFIHALVSTNSILSGSRVVDYFRPGSCTEESDYDFYSIGEANKEWMNTHYAMSEVKISGNAWKLYNTLTQLGVEWTTQEDDHNRNEYEGFTLTLFKGLSKEYRNKRYNIQLLVVESATALDAILRFHSTTVQCFINGYAAVHMYGKMLCNDQAIVWHNNNVVKLRLSRRNAKARCDVCIILSQNSNKRQRLVALRHLMTSMSDYSISSDNDHLMEELIYTFYSLGKSVEESKEVASRLLKEHSCNVEDSAAKAVAKYEKRGIKMLSIQVLIDKWKDLGYTDQYCTRRIGDPLSIIVPFTGYINTDKWDKNVEKSVHRLQNYCWFETTGSTSSIREQNSISPAYSERNIDFQYKSVTGF